MISAAKINYVMILALFSASSKAMNFPDKKNTAECVNFWQPKIDVSATALSDILCGIAKEEDTSKRKALKRSRDTLAAKKSKQEEALKHCLANSFDSSFSIYREWFR